jgi:hypothetical protein
MEENVTYNPEGWYYHNPLKQNDKVDKEPGPINPKEMEEKREGCGCHNKVDSDNNFNYFEPGPNYFEPTDIKSINPKEMEETPQDNSRLTNRDISTYHENVDFYLSKKDFTCAFTYWIINQSPYDTPDISKALKAFDNYMNIFFKDASIGIRKFSYQEINTIIDPKIFELIPEIEKLNHPKIDTGQDIMFSSRYDSIKPDYDFIDLDALARNVMYMIMREYITQR